MSKKSSTTKSKTVRSKKEEKTVPLPAAPEREGTVLSTIVPRGKQTRPYTCGVISLYNVPKYLENSDLKKWASQFGHVTRAAMWKNKKTGGNRNGAFIEFEDARVADIVAKEMTGTIMMHKALQIRVIEDMNWQKARSMFAFADKQYSPKSPIETANATIRKMWSVTAVKGMTVSDAERRASCAGKKLLQASGIKCEWTPLPSIEKALVKTS
ncbi:RNA recognition motif protein [Gregarina niphandrodes]|uniref:RNA recognition motif protein n=1 Tax=Gregarina niphandrodes TaxID=110365 RepID=A0A023AZ02_GRENI|nr:RNA recognition motif protein [Gregarina niphandrodes]EZG43540.1 RNA recognition motif protein [Gregarina niphandrodes]|eukprot:XP_011133225.1 RNA recognition motif protein [Gregarina niphandrodes]